MNDLVQYRFRRYLFSTVVPPEYRKGLPVQYRTDYDTRLLSVLCVVTLLECGSGPLACRTTILSYLQSTPFFGLVYCKTAPLHGVGVTGASAAGEPDERRSQGSRYLNSLRVPMWQIRVDHNREATT